MKLLLTSFGLANATIVAALERLLGKPIGEATVMYVPTALHATLVIRPHLNSPEFPGATADRIAALAEGPTFAIDDASAVVVDGETVTVASEGSWRYFA